MGTFWRIVNQARLKKSLFVAYVISTLLIVLFSIINFSALVPILEVLFNEVKVVVPPNSESLFGIEQLRYWFYSYLQRIIDDHGKKEALIYICLLVLSSVFLANLFRYLADLCLVELRLSIIYHLRKNVFNKLIWQPLASFSEQRKGDVVSRVMNDVQEVETSVIYTIKVYLKEPFMILGYLLILFSMSVKLALYALILIPISGVIISTIARKLKDKARQTQDILGEIGFIVDQMLSGMREIASYGAQTFISDKFDQKNKEYAKFNRSMGNKFQLAGPLSEVLGVGTMVAILIIGGSMVLSDSGELSASQFIAFLIIFSQVLAPAKALSQAHSLMQRGIASGIRVFEIIDNAKNVVEDKSPVGLKSFEDKIEFKNVTFSYGGEDVLSDINLIIEKGKSYALVGASGGGKSTLADLILRFQDPTKGDIILDGQNLKSYRLSDLRKLIALVSQDTLLFNDSVINNIRFGRPHITMDEVVKAAKAANAHNFISSLPQQYETIVGERGSRLSGGERQRIAIARAVLKDAPILILDEATSALDQGGAQLVRDALNVLMKGKTLIVITHRIDTLIASDSVLELQKGRIGLKK